MVNSDPAARDLLKVVFIPDSNVSFGQIHAGSFTEDVGHVCVLQRIERRLPFIENPERASVMSAIVLLAQALPTASSGVDLLHHLSRRRYIGPDIDCGQGVG
jgi:hypothetical protein